MVSGTHLFLGLFNNLAILVVLVAAYGALNSYFENRDRQTRQLVVGLFFGLFAIFCMYVKIPVAEGVIVDQRNTIVALCGAFGGPVAVGICGVMTAAYRVSLGGAGVLAGVVGVSLAAVAGIGLNQWRKQDDSLVKTAGGSLAATIIILPGFLLVGDLQTGWELLKSMFLPYGSAVFAGIFLVGLLLTHEENRLITQLKQQASEQRYRELFENLIDVVFRVDNQGIVTVISPSCETVFGYGPDEILGQPMVDFYRVPSHRHDLVARIREAGHIENFEVEMKKKDGSFVWVSSNAKLLKNADGAEIGIEGVTRDISRLKEAEDKKRQLEENLRQSQKMEAVGTLAGGIAHDFNNILSGIFGYAQLTQRHLADPERAKKDIEQIVKAAKKAAGLVQQILTFSRKSDHTMQPLVLHYEVKEAIQLIRSIIPSTIDIQDDIQSRAVVLADPTQIHQILMNLCTNAYHAMHETGGPLSISLKDITVSARHPVPDLDLLPGAYVELAVRDAGTGMTPEMLGKIFDPYFTTKEVGKGTGLGLAAVLGIVEDHNGRIRVDSEPGKGSVFHIYLPALGNQRNPRSTRIAGEIARGRSEQVLLVDDEESILFSTKELLEDHGYIVRAFSNGEAAFSEFIKNPQQFDLILTDMTMPRMTGDLLSSRLLEVRRDLPIILCSGFSDQISEQGALEIGIRKFLQKPIDSQHLLFSIREVLDSN
ncbi:MAG: ATP-binding protein [bacterium]